MPITIDGSGTISGVSATGLSAVQNLPTGTVKQVVQYTTNSTVATSSTSFVTTGFSASITPSSASNKVLILVSAVMYTGTATAEPQLTVYRGGSNITSAAIGDIFNNVGSIVGSTSGMYLDSPATTSSTTYTLYYKQGNTGSGGSAYLGVNNCQTNIILMEIVG